MTKINFESPMGKKILMFLDFVVFLTISFTIYGIIFAQDSAISTTTNTITNITTITPTNTETIIPTTTITPTNTETIIKSTTTVTPTTASDAPTNAITIIKSVPIRTEFSIKTQTLGFIVKERRDAVYNSKEQLVKIINESVSNVITNRETSLQKNNLVKINNLREELLKKVDSSFSTPTVITPIDIGNLKNEISKGITDIQKVSGEKVVITIENTNLKNVNETMNLLSEAVNNQSQILKEQGADLLYKDSNKDGISDYEAVHVYNMSPVAPAVVSSYQGRSISAGEKVLLGFDPTKTEIVKVEKEDPIQSVTPVVETYKVKEVALTETKAVVLKGQALPNSFITIYIYSTPIIVTVKTDSNGEWQYTLDKELENGDHTVYTASVNNSGNIVAKSTPFLFTKTAEAASLKDTAIVESPTDASKPSLLQGNDIYTKMVVGIIIVLLLILLLVIIGMPSKKSKDVV